MVKIVERTNEYVSAAVPERVMGAGILDDVAPAPAGIDELGGDAVPLFDKIELGAARPDEEVPATGPW